MTRTYSFGMHCVASTAAVLCLAPQASAAVYEFSVVSAVQNNGDFSYVPTYEFSVDSVDVSQIDDTTYKADGVATTGHRPSLGAGGDETYNADYRFYTGDAASLGGGFDDGGTQHSYFSDQLFSTSKANIVFVPGTYKLYYDSNNATPDATLKISGPSAVAPLPEPATWASMLVGLAGAGGWACRRRKSVGALASGTA